MSRLEEGLGLEMEGTTVERVVGRFLGDRGMKMHKHGAVVYAGLLAEHSHGADCLAIACARQYTSDCLLLIDHFYCNQALRQSHRLHRSEAFVARPDVYLF